MNEVAIRVEALSKKYHLGGRQERYKTLRDALTAMAAAPFRRLTSPFRGQPVNGAAETIWALDDVSFEVKCGEVIGIIGRNGAGKSTLLKILTRITEPTKGYAKLYGRVGSLLEVGTGFHPELTGRENVYLNGAILGMKKAEIDRKFDEIVAFAEIERFMDTPVKHYSSGMHVRLAFAVAAHLEPEILLVDEVLAVGDAAFQRKCLGKMGDVARQGRTVLFVSHNMAVIAQLCERALWLDGGRLKCSGRPSEVIASYLMSGTISHSTWTQASPPPPGADSHITSVRVLAEGGDPTPIIEFGKQLEVEIAYAVFSPMRDLSVVCRVSDSQGNIVWTSWDTDSTEWNGRVREPGRYVSNCEVPGGLLRPGRYLLSVGSHVSNVKLLAWHENILAFDVSEVGYRFNLNRIGVITPLLRWTVQRDGTSRTA